jgi:CheY-like chemotaxis protein
MKPGVYVRLTVRDTGFGMGREELSHIFEPFFTTKRESKGTGLGLSTVYGIVKQNNGFIKFDSEIGQGTTATIYLPQVDEPVEEVIQRTDGLKLSSGGETILVVEDEQNIRDILAGILPACGYRIILAQDGEEALEQWEKNKDQIDLLLADVVLPGISGIQLSQRLLASNPGLKVIYMSGFPDDVIKSHGFVDKDMSLIQKPFTAMTLTQKIRDVFK